jgi:prepilin-type N-terminal cleavage/methylation domain-containing protein
MKTAYTLIELLFVIVIIGVLSGVGFYNFKPAYLQNDAHMVKMKIEQVRYEAIHYDRVLGEESSEIGCIDLASLQNSTSTIDKNYKFHATINPNSGKICFDIFGRLDGDSSSDTNITLSYQDNNITLHILKNSGFVDIIY